MFSRVFFIIVGATNRAQGKPDEMHEPCYYTSSAARSRAVVLGKQPREMQNQTKFAGKKTPAGARSRFSSFFFLLASPCLPFIMASLRVFVSKTAVGRVRALRLESTYKSNSDLVYSLQREFQS